jgi:DNA invertase Pin-like site-specific DNA recombinase
MLGVFTEFVTNLRRERQLEGIVKAKAAGVYKAGPLDRARAGACIESPAQATPATRCSSQ